MAEFMGVRVHAVDEAVDDFAKLSSAVPVSGSVASGSSRFVLDGKLNANYKAVNLLLDQGATVRRVDDSSTGLEPGDFIVSGGSGFADVAEATGVDFRALGREPSSSIHDHERMRVGMYQRHRGGNMDEGWTRFLLEQFAFP